MVAGIDVSKDTLDVCIRGDRTDLDLHKVPNTPEGLRKLVKLLKKADRVLMEATGTYHLACAEALWRVGLCVVVLNPRQAHHFAKARLQRNKTDRVDATLLAELAQGDSHRLWSPPSEPVRELQGLLRIRETLVRESAARKAQLKNPGICAYERSFYQSDLDRLQSLIGSLALKLRECIDSDPDLKTKMQLLESIPGIGLITATTTLAHMPATLESAKQASAFVGLNPRRIESGQMRGLTRLSKCGNSQLRKLFMIAAWSASLNRSPLRDFYLRLIARGKAKAAAMAALANKLVRVAFAVLKGGMPFEACRLTST